MAFQQAGIEVEKLQEFGQLKAAVERAFAPERVDKYLKALEAKGIRVRDWQAVLDRKMLEKVGALEKGVSAKKLYEALTVSDQGLMREFYLASLEAVDVAWRHKFYRIYASY